MQGARHHLVALFSVLLLSAIGFYSLLDIESPNVQINYSARKHKQTSVIIGTHHVNETRSSFIIRRRDVRNTSRGNFSRFPDIDLDLYVPSVDHLYRRLVLVVAFSENHYLEGLGFIGTAQEIMPGKRILVYDLGLENKSLQKVKTLCDVEVRDFPFDAYPHHVRNLETYAFKPILINLALNEIGIIYYGDASVRFMKPLKLLIKGIERHHGYVTHIRSFNPNASRMIFPKTFQKLGVSEEEYYRSCYAAPLVQAGNQLIVNSSTIQKKLMQPWLECALDKECIAPKGSNLKNHRQDASVLRLLVYKNFYKEWSIEDNDNKYIEQRVRVERSSDGLAYRPQICLENTPSYN